MFKNSIQFFTYLNKMQAQQAFKHKPEPFFSRSLQTVKRRKRRKYDDDYGFDEKSIKQLAEEMRQQTEAQKATAEEKLLHRVIRMTTKHKFGRRAESEMKAKEEPISDGQKCIINKAKEYLATPDGSRRSLGTGTVSGVNS